MPTLTTDLLDASPEEIATRLTGLYDAATGGRGERLVIYGAGKLGRETRTGLRGHGIEPLAFVDTDPARWGEPLDGLTVVSPLEATERWAETATFVVAVSAGAVLREDLVAAGCRSVVPYTFLWWRFPETFLPLHGVCRPESTLAYGNEVRAVQALFADERSRAAYRAQIEWRLSLDYSVLPAPTSAREIYFLPEISPHEREVFVDVGAFDGDTLKTLFERYGERVSRAIALEPDPENWNALVRNAQPYGARAALHAVAAASTSGSRSFRADGTPGAALAADGETTVRTVRLDDLLAEETPTFIKIDVEGAELDALRGAERTIRRHRPVLAVCLYHKPEDLWEIPLFVASLDADYRFLFRAHAEECWETILYAIPPDRYRP